MKKIISLFIITALLLTGCSKEEQMPDFIPTMAPEKEEAKEAAPPKEESDPEVEPSPATIYVGETTTKYVKLSKYNDTLNVRSSPSTSGDKVGFLVHTEVVDVIEIKDGWASFLYKDAICYVNASYLVDEKPAYIEPPAPTASSGSNNSSEQKSSNLDI